MHTLHCALYVGLSAVNHGAGPACGLLCLPGFLCKLLIHPNAFVKQAFLLAWTKALAWHWLSVNTIAFSFFFIFGG